MLQLNLYNCGPAVQLELYRTKSLAISKMSANNVAEKTKTSRKPKFSREEVEALVTAYEKYNNVLTAKFGPSITKAKKDHCWIQITNTVNAVGSGFVRSVEDVKMKWKDFKKNSKAKAVKYRKDVTQTGSGTQPDQLDQLVERTVAIIGEVSISGIPGGMEIGGGSDDEDFGTLGQDPPPATLPTILPAAVASTSWQTLTEFNDEQPSTAYLSTQPPTCDRHTQTIASGNDPMARLLEQGERQIAAQQRQATAMERLVMVLERIEGQLASIE